jgi:hypothetical protein
MPRELLNANITHVSYVDKGANKKKFFLTKSEEQNEAPVFEKQVKVLAKADDAEQLVYGIVYEPEVEDAHGDFMNATEIEKAAHQFMKDARNVDTQHDFEAGAGEVVESYVAPADFELEGQTITKGSWVLVTKASEDVWEKIQKGEITGYSMAGTAETIEKSEEPAQAVAGEEVHEDTQMKSFFQTMKEFFNPKTHVEKGEVKNRFYDGKKKREFFDALHIFEDFFYSEIWNEKPDVSAIKDHALDFADLLQEIANSPDILKALGPKPEQKIEKAGKKISTARLAQIKSAYDALGTLIDEVDPKEEEGDEEVMKAEEIQKMLDDALAPISAKLETLEKSSEEVTDKVQKTEEKVEKGEEKTDETVKQFTDALEKALAPINDRLEAVETARGIQKSEEVIQKESEKKSIWDGLL